MSMMDLDLDSRSLSRLLVTLGLWDTGSPMQAVHETTITSIGSRVNTCHAEDKMP